MILFCCPFNIIYQPVEVVLLKQTLPDVILLAETLFYDKLVHIYQRTP